MPISELTDSCIDYHNQFNKIRDPKHLKTKLHKRAVKFRGKKRGRGRGRGR